MGVRVVSGVVQGWCSSVNKGQTVAVVSCYCHKKVKGLMLKVGNCLVCIVYNTWLCQSVKIGENLSLNVRLSVSF